MLTNPSVVEFLDKTRGEIQRIHEEEARRKQQEKEDLLISLGLFTADKEYLSIDPVAARRRGLTDFDMVDGVAKYYRMTGKKAVDVTDEEYAEILKVVEEKKRLTADGTPEPESAAKPAATPVPAAAAPSAPEPCEYEARPAQNSTSRAASFLNALAIILWIGGVIVSILTARVPQIDYRGNVETKFQFSTFLASLVLYGAAGAFALCMAELMQNVQNISDFLSHLKITPRK